MGMPPERMYLKYLSLTLFIVWLVDIHGLNNGLALNPPMGWLSWERFGCQVDCNSYPDTCVSELLYLRQAQRLVQDGYLQAGYEYINIDDCWSAMDRENGSWVENRTRFPHGIKNLSTSLHSWGLKLGLYADIGSQTCMGYPGLQGHFEQDAQTVADWGVDSIKVDACHANETLFNETYPAFGAALNRTGRPIMYSCSWPNDYYERHHHWEDPNYLNHGIKQTCNSWRNYIDVTDSWNSIEQIIQFWARTGPNDTLVRAAGVGGWNDPDMLVVGNPGLSLTEQQAQFAFWAVFAAPLMISADLYTMPEESQAILLNHEVIAVNQDRLGRQGWYAGNLAGNGRVWVRELLPSNFQSLHTDISIATRVPQGSSDTWAILVENRNNIFGPATYHVNLSLYLPPPSDNDWELFHVRDLIRNQDLGAATQQFSLVLDESSIALLKVTRWDGNIPNIDSTVSM